MILLSFSVTFMQVVRFPVSFSSDALVEYQTAIHQSASWNPANTLFQGDAFDVYLSVTILPQMISQTLGVPLFVVFDVVLMGVVALMPFLFYVTISKYFGNGKITCLAIALVPQFLFYQDYTQTFRASLALVFLFLLLYSLRVPGTRGSILTLLFGAGLAFSYFVVAYFGLALCILFYLYPYIVKPFRWKQQRIVTGYRVLLIGVEVALWAFFVGLTEVGWELGQLLALLASWMSGVSSLSVFSSYPSGSALGSVVTAWLDLEFVLIGVGALLAIYYVIRHDRDDMGLSGPWVLAGTLGLAAILATVYVPGVGALLGLARLLIYSIPFLMIFLAFSLLQVNEHAKFVFVAFILLMLPMNLFLPAYQLEPMTYPTSSLPATRILANANRPLTEAQVVGALFIAREANLVQTDVGVDSIAGASLLFAGSINWLTSVNIVTVPDGKLDTQVKYFAFSNVLLDSGLFSTTVSSAGSVSIFTARINTTVLSDNLSIVYNDGSIYFGFR